MLKYIFDFEIHYRINRSLDICLYWLYSGNNSKSKELKLSIWKNHKLTYISGHEDEWGTRSWKHITLWKVRGD